MELVAGQPYWLIESGLPYHYPKLLKNAKCGVLIIGGGISGAITAYMLTAAGIDCMLLDSRSIGLGSTCASTSLLQYELDIPLHRLKKKVGESRATRAYQLCGEAVDKLVRLMTDIGFKQFDSRNSLFFSQHKRQQQFMKREFLAREQAGFEVEMLDGKQLKEAFNLTAAFGILSAKGATNNAYALTHELLQHCLRKGLKVFERTRITTIDYGKDRVILKTENGFTITTDYVVNATGYEVNNFIDKKIVDLDCTYALVTQAQPENTGLCSERIMMWNTDEPYLYLCTSKHNRIMIGGRDERFVNLKTMHTYLPRKQDLLEKNLQRLFPSIALKGEFAWSGVFGKTKDSLPYIGNYLKTPRTFYALGFGGNGITFSLVAAEIIRDLLLGKKNKDAEIFSFTR